MITGSSTLQSFLIAGTLATLLVLSPAFAQQKDESRVTFAPTSYKKMSAESPILTQTIRINFYPNSANVFEPQHDEAGKAVANTLYDPSVAATLEKVARLVGQYERAVVAVVGHADSSMKGKGTRFEDVKALSSDRAEAVKQALVKKYNIQSPAVLTSCSTCHR